MRRVTAILAGLLLAAAGAVLAGGPPAAAATAAPALVLASDFPDPDVSRFGSTY